MCLENGVLAAVRTRAFAGPRTSVLHLYRRTGSGGWRIVGRAPVASSTALFPAWAVELDGDRVAVSNFDGVDVYRWMASGALVQEHELELVRTVAGFDDGRLIAVGFGAVRAIDVPPTVGTTSACRLRGLETCGGSGAARLRVHDIGQSVMRRAVAEITNATPGASAFVLRSIDPGFAPALGGQLCLDRRNAMLVGPPRAISPSGRATFSLDAGTSWNLHGFEAADHLQAVIWSAAPELTNSIAWLP